MPLTVPTLDNRRYQDLVDEMRARISVHTPEWTNHYESDPGVTMIELFAFLAENMNYRANYMPERNRLKFLSLLGVPLAPGSAARGMVTFVNERGPLRTITLNDDLEVRAGEVPFRTDIGVDVLPVEARLYYKKKLEDTPAEQLEYYRQLYASYLGTPSLNAPEPLLYETVPFTPRGATGISVGDQTIDQSLWIALLMRSGDKPFDEDRKKDVREVIAGRVLSIGVIPQLTDDSRHLVPGMKLTDEGTSLLQFLIPSIPPDGKLSTNLSERLPQYRSLATTTTDDILTRPGIVQITLPTAGELTLWSNLDPIESGIGDFPPSLEDTAVNERLITWLRIKAPTSVPARLLWVGFNAATVNQRARVVDALLPTGTGEPDQFVTLAHTPVIPDSVKLRISTNKGNDLWERIDDLFAAGPEVPTPSPRQPPGTPVPQNLPIKVFKLDAESGQLRFGDGTNGERPAFGAVLRVSYDYSVGRGGNVGSGAINGSPALPSGIQVTNPMPTWGGADPESVSEGEKQITRYVQHRDRLVTAADFEAITLRTPGVEIGRVEVLPTYNPELPNSEPGDAPGAVTVMLIPKYDPVNPAAPMPDRLFLDAVCKHIDARRLVTTEVFLRAPKYHRVWVSIGITIAPRQSIAQVTELVKAAVAQFISPLPAPGTPILDDQSPLFAFPQSDNTQRGWPLGKSVLRLEISAIANRVTGVLLVNGVRLIDENRNELDEIPMRNLDLPYLAGIAVGIGAAPDMSQIPGFDVPILSASTASFAPVPVIPEECD